ncbi:hypothetical protein HDV03_001099 [Kappamyces sp. JEL0829]|nr:hypothetical protein HDV03_001099 [Kappamyces sp. JEL0829]
MSSALAGLKRRPGIQKWRVRKNGEYYDTHVDDKGLLPSMFPQQDADDLHLERCMRIYPHHQNTGGFFIAVLEKLGPFGPLDRGREPRRRGQTKRTAEDTTLPEQPSANAASLALKASGWAGQNEMPFLFLSESNAVARSCCEAYGLDDSFPRNLFVVRSVEEKNDFRHIYLVTEKAKTILLAQNANSLKLVNTGVKIFTKGAAKGMYDAPDLTGRKAEFRVSNEGVQTIQPYLATERQFSLTFQDLATLIKLEYPKFTDFTQEGRELLESLVYGCYLLKFDPAQEKSYHGSIKSTVIVPFLRAHVSASLLLDKAERKSLLSRLTGEDLEFVSGLEDKK